MHKMAASGSALATDVRAAYQSVLRAWRVTGVACLLLGVGIGVAAAGAAVVRSVLIGPLPFPDASRLFVLTGATWSGSAIDVPTWFSRAPGVELVATYAGGRGDVRVGDLQVRTDIAEVSRSFFALFPGPVRAGRSFDASEEGSGSAGVALLSHGFAQQLTSDPATMVGTTLYLDNRPYRIAGVLSSSFQWFTDVKVWIPRIYGKPPGHLFDAESAGGAISSTDLLVKLRTRSSAALVLNDLRRLQRELETGDGQANGSQISLWSLDTSVAGERGPSVIALFAACILLLILSVSNVTHMLLVRGFGRRRELDIRQALGLRPARLRRLLLLEGLLIAVPATVLGSALALGLWKAARELVPSAVSSLGEHGGIGQLTGYASGIAIVASLAASAFPALFFARHMGITLRADGAGAVGRRRVGVRFGLVAVQVAAATTLLVMAAVLMRSVVAMDRTDLGFSESGVLTLEVHRTHDVPLNTERYVSALRQVGSAPEVETAALTSRLLWGRAARSLWVGLPGSEVGVMAHVTDIAGDYLTVLGIPLRAGRAFSDSEVARSAQVALVDSRMALELSPGSVGGSVGRRIRVSDDLYEIVGVVGTVKTSYRESVARPQVYVPLASLVATREVRDHVLLLRLKPRMAVSSDVITDPTLSTTPPAPLDRRIGGARANAYMTGRLVGLLALAAVSIAALGLYASMRYEVERRRHEIAVRLALGCTPSRARREVARAGALASAVGLMLGLGAALATTRAIRSLLYGVSETDALSLIGCSLIVSVVSYFAVRLPTGQAEQIDITGVLREE